MRAGVQTLFNSRRDSSTSNNGQGFDLKPIKKFRYHHHHVDFDGFVCIEEILITKVPSFKRQVALTE